MNLQERLLWKGYFPENLPPAFSSADLADHLVADRGADWWSRTNSPVRSASYSASKRGSTRRIFSVVHPTTMRDLSKFVSMRWGAINQFFQTADFSLSVPREVIDGDRALEIASYQQVEAARAMRLSHFRFVAKTDISRFYHSIYTHSVPWAFHGKDASKMDREPRSIDIFFNRADHILRCGQDGQTIGIPVGPDTSRVIAEVVATAIDVEFKRRCTISDVAVIRHVDDVWIGANSHADVENALWQYREAMREFELDINENKTRIYSSDFRFADIWPTDLSAALETALGSSSSNRFERLRAALEKAFMMAVSDGDDGILKYVIRYLDRHDLGWENWEIVEPFLKRSVVHFGHTVDYVARVIVWRQLAKGDLDLASWSRILTSLVDKHGRIGNDSEVCWSLYACAKLGLTIDASVAENIARNCNALSLLSILNCVEGGLTKRSIFDAVFERVRLDSARGPLWPVLMEWKSKRWPRHDTVHLNNDIIGALVGEDAVVCDLNRLPVVFSDVQEHEFDEVGRAIEDRPTMYDDEDEDEDEDDSGPW